MIVKLTEKSEALIAGQETFTMKMAKEPEKEAKTTAKKKVKKTAGLVLNKEQEESFEILRITKNRKVQVIGPAAPAVGKVKDVYRKVLYLKQESYEILIEMKDRMEQYIELNRGFAKMRIQFDFDPMSGF